MVVTYICSLSLHSAKQCSFSWDRSICCPLGRAPGRDSEPLSSGLLSTGGSAALPEGAEKSGLGPSASALWLAGRPRHGLRGPGARV